LGPGIENTIDLSEIPAFLELIPRHSKSAALSEEKLLSLTSAYRDFEMWRIQDTYR
jgi:hypothetical protein